MPVILVVDDEPLQREILKTILDDSGYETYTAASGEEALRILRKYNPDVLLTDLKMEGMDGIELIESISLDSYTPTMIIMTAHGTITSAVEAIKKGAFDYLTKPLNKNSLLLTVQRAVERSELMKENRQLHKELFDRFKMEGIVGKSEKMKEAIDIMKKIKVLIVDDHTLVRDGIRGAGFEFLLKTAFCDIIKPYKVLFLS